MINLTVFYDLHFDHIPFLMVQEFLNELVFDLRLGYRAYIIIIYLK